MRNANADTDQRVARHIALSVRVEMNRQKLSQQILADRLGWTQPRVSRRVTLGKTWVPFDVDELAEVAAALGKPMAAFLPPELAALAA